jgi:hypothetical protein
VIKKKTQIEARDECVSYRFYKIYPDMRYIRAHIGEQYARWVNEHAEVRV